ncbi:MAG: nucleotide exchange factor GrpE [Candidatus Hydrogenedentes bacterium]|nr:nucleotide exchange factor GrpE [Candidatus Hydrogenedentota bacterium]
MIVPYWLRRLLDRAGLWNTPPPPPPDFQSELLDRTARMADFAMELQDRERRMHTMRGEYARLESERTRQVSEAAERERDRLFARLAPPLANLDMLMDLAAAGRPASPEDVRTVHEQLRNELERQGLQRIGAAGAETAYDDTAHESMDGSPIPCGAPVVVRVPGYRTHGRTLLKAVVSRKP